MCLLVNVVFNSDSEAFSCLVKLWIASSLARLLVVIWAPVGDVSILVSANFVYHNNGRTKAYNNYACGVRNLHSRPSEKVWRYFWFLKEQGKITTKDKVICKICMTKLTYHATTSNLRASCKHYITASWKRRRGLTFNIIKKNILCFSSEKIIACLLTLTDTMPSCTT